MIRTTGVPRVWNWYLPLPLPLSFQSYQRYLQSSYLRTFVIDTGIVLFVALRIDGENLSPEKMDVALGHSSWVASARTPWRSITICSSSRWGPGMMHDALVNRNWKKKSRIKSLPSNFLWWSYLYVTEMMTSTSLNMSNISSLTFRISRTTLVLLLKCLDKFRRAERLVWVEKVRTASGHEKSYHNLSLFAQNCKCSSAESVLEVFHAYMAASQRECWKDP